MKFSDNTCYNFIMNRIIAGGTWLVLALSGAAPLVGETMYAWAGGQLFRTDPDTFVVEAVAPPAPAPPSQNLLGLTSGPDGFLYGLSLSPQPIGLASVIRLDPADGTGVEAALCSMGGGTGSGVGLAFGGDGRLWMTIDHVLMAVDLDTGNCGPPTALTAQVRALAEYEGRLHALTQLVPGDGINRLETLNPDTGTLTTLFAFPNTDWGILDAEFDSQGNLRYVAVGGGIIAVTSLSYWSIGLAVGPQPVMTAQRIFDFQEQLASLVNLAGPAGGGFVVDVPGPGPVATSALALLLLVGGLALLRRV